MTIRNLEYLFAPRSVALIGASEKPQSIGATVLRNLSDAGFAGAIWPVNPGCRTQGLRFRPQPSGCVHSQDEPRLIQTLARAHQWLEQLPSGEVCSLRMIAAAVGKNERYVSKLIRTAFLAPDLVEAVLEQRAPKG